MLTKYSIATVLLLGAAIHASAQTQAPLSFDANAALATLPTVYQSASNSPTATSPNATAQARSEPLNASQNPLVWFSSVPWDNAISGMMPARASNTLGWIATEKQRTQPIAATLPASLAAQSADALIQRTEPQLKLMQLPTEQTVAPKQILPQPATTSVASATTKATNDGRKISTKLSLRALESGEVASEFHWLTADGKQVVKDKLPKTAIFKTEASEVIAASEESLIESVIQGEATELAIWQDADKQAGEAMRDVAGLESTSDNLNAQVQAFEKFSTATMVGPMKHPGQLFSMLEVDDRFQGYAEPVQAMRTRDLDSPSHAPYTLENYTYISPVFYHKPLYFEQPNLERYGQGTYRCIQPAASSIHFFGTIPLLPYKMLKQSPCENLYTLGNQRPGNCNAVQKRVVLGH